ncbi:MAG: hypothetical protein HY026_05325 [Deltaproteobacteria bacterium]|nr:hypothetical protein [Deltaproteobacteria bacterium]
MRSFAPIQHTWLGSGDADSVTEPVALHTEEAKTRVREKMKNRCFILCIRHPLF